MQAWDAFRRGGPQHTRDLLAELVFARHFNAHWHYWPPTLFDENDESRKSLRLHQEFLETEKRGAQARAANHRTKKDLYFALLNATWGLCAEPLRQMEFSPEIEEAQKTKGTSAKHPWPAVMLYWNFRPVQFLGEEELEHSSIPHEEPYVAAPYFLMFLLDLTSGGETHVCADLSCKRVFEVRRRNQLYCNYDCAHRAAVRSYRRRKGRL